VNWEPLKITAWLTCGVVSDAALPIDGILYYQAMRLAHGPQDMTLPGGHAGVNPQGARVPIQRVHAVDWYYKASFAQWSQPCVEGTDHWNKRFDLGMADLIDFAGKRGRVIVEQSRYKAYHMPVFYRHCLSVWWYVVGDREAIAGLLWSMTHVGKKTSQGYGQVLRWEIEPAPADYSQCGPDGQLMRAIPDDGGILYGIRPSYWDRRNQVRCRLPNSLR